MTTAATRRYSLSNPPPSSGPLNGRETTQEAEILELQALQAERDSDDGRCIQLMERALQIRSAAVEQLATQLRFQRQREVPTTLTDEQTAALGALYDAAERLVVKCNTYGVYNFKKSDFNAALPVLHYALELTKEGAYPLCEVEDRRIHLRGVTLNNLGCFERRRGHFTEALAYMQQSMDTTGVESPVAYMNMSAILVQLRLSEEGASMAQRAIDLLSTTPEDPSLLAVAHHNLAMALEPMDSARCLEEYAAAYHIACATIDADSTTAKSIERSWRRYLHQHGGSSAAATPSRNNYFAAGSSTHGGGGTVRRPSYTDPGRAVGGNLQSTVPPLTAALADDQIEIFPHPYLCSGGGGGRGGASAVTEDGGGMASTALGNLRSPRMPQYPQISSVRRPMVPHPASHRGTASSKLHTSNLPPEYFRPIATGHAAVPSAATRKAAAAAAAATVRSGRQAAAPHGSSTPPRRAADLSGPSGASSARSGPRGGAPPLTKTRRQPVAPSSMGRRHSSLTQRQQEMQEAYKPKPATATTTGEDPPPQRRPVVPAEQRSLFGRQKARLSPLQGGSSSAPAPTQPNRGNEANASTTSDRAKAPSKRRTVSNSNTAPPRTLPPIRSTTSSFANSKDGSSPNQTHRHSSVRPEVPAASGNPNTNAREVSSFERSGGDLVAYITDRLDMLIHDEEELERKYGRAVLIQKHYRGHLSRRKVGSIKKSHTHAEKYNRVRRNIAARKIQRAYRQHRRRRRNPLARVPRRAGPLRGTEHIAAAQLQRVARGWLARREAERRRRYAMEAGGAAKKIQNWYRSRRSKRELRRLRAATAAEEAAAREQERQDFAATTIQSQWRSCMAVRRSREQLAELRAKRIAAEEWSRTKAACDIQCWWRCGRARQEAGALRAERDALEARRREYESKRSAAIKLQSFGRMVIAQRAAMPLLTEARFRAAGAINKGQAEYQAASVVQRAYRGHRARRQLRELQEGFYHGLSKSRLLVFVHLMQRTGRGCLARAVLAAEARAMAMESARYLERLRALQEEDATKEAIARAREAARLRGTERFLEEEDSSRAEVELHELRGRLRMAETKRALHAAALSPLQVQHTTAAAESKLSPTEDVAMPAASTMGDREVLDGFAKVIKAKAKVAALKNERDVQKQKAEEADQEQLEHHSRRVIGSFLRCAAAKHCVHRASEAVRQYLDEQGDDAEAAEEEEEEVNAAASRSHSSSLSNEVDMSDSDLGAWYYSRDRCASSDGHPKTVTAHVQDEYDDAVISAELKSLEQRHRAEYESRRLQRELDELQEARQQYRMRKIDEAESAADLAPYRRERLTLSKPPPRQSAAEQGPTLSSLLEQQRRAETAPPMLISREAAAATNISRVYRGHEARQRVQGIQNLQSEYLRALHERELNDQAPLDYRVLDQYAELFPRPAHDAPKPIATSPCGNLQEAVEGGMRRPLTAEQIAEEALLGQLREAEAEAIQSDLLTRQSLETLGGFAKIVKAKAVVRELQEARDTYRHQQQTLEDNLRASTASLVSHEAEELYRLFEAEERIVAAERDQDQQQQQQSPAAAPEILDGFAKIIRAKSETRGRQEASLQRANEDEASHVITQFIRGAAAQKIVEKRRSAVQAHLSQDNEDEGSTEGGVRRPLTAEQIAEEEALLGQLREAEAEAIQSDLLTRQSLETLGGFAKIVKAKAVVRELQEARDTYRHQQQTLEDNLRASTASLVSHEAEELYRLFEAEERIVAAERDQDQQQQQQSPAAAPEILDGFAKIIRAKSETRGRQEASLQRANEDEASHVITQFIRGAAAQKIVEKRRSAVQAHLSQDNEDEEGAHASLKVPGHAREPSATEDAAVRVIQNFFKVVLAKGELLDRQYAAEQNLSAEFQVDELLNIAATEIQRVFRGYLDRRASELLWEERERHRQELMARAMDEECAEAGTESSNTVSLSGSEDMYAPPERDPELSTAAPDAAEDRGVERTGSWSSAKIEDVPGWY